MKAFFDTKPQTFEKVGDGSTRYRFNIASKDVIMNDITVTQWSCDEVVVFDITRHKLTADVLNELYGNDVENKYINDFNAATNGILDSSYIDAYKQFLFDRKALKDQIDADCKVAGII